LVVGGRGGGRPIRRGVARYLLVTRGLGLRC